MSENDMRPEVEAVAKLMCHDIHPKRLKWIAEECGYWRKANWLHGWFVDTVQEGSDDCKEYYVPKELLQDLLKKIKQALKKGDHGDFEPREGFFFGSNEMTDEEWADELEYTRKVLQAAFDDYSDDWEFYYRSSW